MVRLRIAVDSQCPSFLTFFVEMYCILQPWRSSHGQLSSWPSVWCPFLIPRKILHGYPSSLFARQQNNDVPITTMSLFPDEITRFSFTTTQGLCQWLSGKSHTDNRTSCSGSRTSGTTRVGHQKCGESDTSSTNHIPIGRPADRRASKKARGQAIARAGSKRANKKTGRQDSTQAGNKLADEQNKKTCKLTSKQKNRRTDKPQAGERKADKPSHTKTS